MGKTKTADCQPMFSRGRLSRFRSVVKPPTSRRTIDYSLGIPSDGIADLSEYQEDGIIPLEMISAVSPVSVIHEDPDQAEAYRQQVIASFSERAPGNFKYLPEEYQGGTPAHIQLVPSSYSTRVIERNWEKDPLDPVANSPINRPIEIITVEKYTEASGTPNRWSENRGIAHYVFDPISDRWYLVDRWGRGPKKKRSDTITPYRQSAAAQRRMTECLSAVQNSLLKKPEEFPTVSVETVEERMKDLRQQQRSNIGP